MGSGLRLELGGPMPYLGVGAGLGDDLALLADELACLTMMVLANQPKEVGLQAWAATLRLPGF